MMEEIYLCSTYYHLLIAMQKALLSKEQKPDLMVTDHIADGEKVAENIKKSGIFANVYYSGVIREYECKNSLDRLLFLHRKNPKQIAGQLLVDLSSYRTIYLFHDDTWMSHYLQDIKKPYHLLEDALDSYVIITDTIWAYMVQGGFWKRLMKKIFRLGYQYAGASPYTVSIEVNNKKGIHVCAPEKVIEAPRKEMSARLTEAQKQLIWDTFEGERPIGDTQTSKILLLTQPLSADKVVNGTAEQIQIYRGMVEEYRALFEDGWQLYIKPHPRDGVDYAKYFPEAVLLKREMPVELLDYVKNLHFQIGVSLFSTALWGLACVEEKCCPRLNKEITYERYVE